MVAAHTSRAAAFVLLAGAALLIETGCDTSGRIGELHIIDGGVIVSDAQYLKTAFVCSDRVTHLPGALVPSSPGATWYVVAQPSKRLAVVRSSRMGTTRLPHWVQELKFTVVDPRSGATRPLPNTVENDDDQIIRIRCDGRRLIAQVTARFIVGGQSTDERFVVCELPDGGFTPITPEEGFRLLPRNWSPPRFDDLRASAARAAATRPARATRNGRKPADPWEDIQKFEQLKAAGLNHGDWGEVDEREVGGQWEAVFRPPTGGQIVLLRGNDFAVREKNSDLQQMLAPILP